MIAMDVFYESEYLVLYTKLFYSKLVSRSPYRMHDRFFARYAAHEPATAIGS